MTDNQSKNVQSNSSWRNWAVCRQFSLDTRIHKPLLGAMCDESTFSPNPSTILSSVFSAFASTSMTSSSTTATAVSDSVGSEGLVVGWLFSFSFFSCCLRSLEEVLRNFSHGFLLVWCCVGEGLLNDNWITFPTFCHIFVHILSWSKTIPSRSASGLGGHPGTYTSTGTIWSTPFVTEYESQYGPPQFAHDPMEITYLGSGICSHSLLTAGAILSVTVPETTKSRPAEGLLEVE